MDEDDIKQVGSIELISSLIKDATLSKEERERLKKELEQEETGGKGTIWLETTEEYEKIVDECKGNLLSPGGAAAKYGISRARVHQLEAEGKIRVYRMKAKEEPYTEDDFKEELKTLPFWIRPFISFKKPKAGCYAFVDMDDLEKYIAQHSKKKG